ncbi:ABC transporter ATP-binding protein/permease [Spiroplasma sabaudiense Ar-1343]|uniref:ABC transporter ATP-binding protein/permease n=1 Tax=Spiroplasma sabaudiense Ar-1343 TaxID=1276257 RepID=W6A992_9MOLU|nr:ABC transporter ATP-binding protein [Spiroplasma sabaudiense]AHI53688.1 ABC transporter ATP-binding protein/permease [Spiroplasma sabaudiense Ar-1343]
MSSKKNKVALNQHEAIISSNQAAEELITKKNKKSFFSLLSDYFKRYWIITILIFVVTLLSSIATVLGPKITERLMGTLMAGQLESAFKSPINGDTISDFNDFVKNTYSFIGAKIVNDKVVYFSVLFGMQLTWTGWIYVQLVLFGFIAIFTFISNFLAGLMGKRIEISLRNKALEKLVKQDMSYYSDKKIGEILTKIVSDTQIIGEQAQQVPVTMLSAIFTFFGSLIVMSTINSYLTIVVVITMLIILATIFVSFAIVKKMMFKVRSSITRINGDVTDRINTVRLIKASGTEEYETQRFKDVHEDYYSKSKKLVNMQAIMITIMIAGISSIQVIIVIAAAIKYNNNIATLSVVLTSFISGVGTMIGPLMQMVRVAVGIASASTSSQRIYAIIKSESIMDPHYDPNEGIHIEHIDGDIIFKDVEFAYPEKPEQLILPKFNITFEKGKSYAFVGETGVGKSTISKLLLRFYDPSNGEVLINGNINLKDVQLSSYLDKVGYVEQEPQILFGDVMDNIRYGRFNASDEQVIEAAKKAELHDLVQTWPDGYKTILGERGFMLSGGQKQRLVIARMFLKDPELLILDEATSALDNIVEKEIQGNLEALMKGRTTISIAHRLSTIKNSDKIIVLAKGIGAAQSGTFDELKNKPGHFQQLYKAGLMD